MAMQQMVPEVQYNDINQHNDPTTGQQQVD